MNKLNNKGFAVSGVIYTILIICLTSMVILLGTFRDRKTILDQIKRETFEELNYEITNETIGKPTVIGGSTVLDTERTFTIIDPVSLAGINYYQYYVTDEETDIPDKNTMVTGAVTGNTVTIKRIGTYIYFRAISVKGTIGQWSDISNLYVKGACDYSIGKYWEFNYKGSIDPFDVPCDGTYKLEVYGAQGGSYVVSGGKGGYSRGYIDLITGTDLYIAVGGQGTGAKTYRDGVSAGGYNGGGNGRTDGAYDKTWYGSAGGGATHIAKVDGTLTEIGVDSIANGNLLIVAGAGGGGLYSNSGNAGAGVLPAYNWPGGYGGGLNGQTTSYNNTATGGSQTAGGSGNTGGDGSFGQGGVAGNAGSGGGAGLYGGEGSNYYTSGAGGSGYLSSSLISDTTNMTNSAQSGNGYARITLTEIDGITTESPYITWDMDDSDFLSEPGVIYTGSPTVSAGILTYTAPASSEYAVTYSMDMGEISDLKTIESRVYISSNSTGEFRLYVSDSDRRTLLIFNGLNKTGKIQYYNRSNTYVEIGSGIDFSGWHTYKVELDSVNGMKIYMDDVQVGSAVSYSLLRDSDSEFYGFSTRIGTVKYDWVKMKKMS